MSKHITVTCTNEVHAALMQYMRDKKETTSPGIKVSMSNYVNDAIRKSLESDGITIAESPKKVQKSPLIVSETPS